MPSTPTLNVFEVLAGSMQQNGTGARQPHVGPLEQGDMPRQSQNAAGSVSNWAFSAAGAAQTSPRICTAFDQSSTIALVAGLYDAISSSPRVCIAGLCTETCFPADVSPLYSTSVQIKWIQCIQYIQFIHCMLVLNHALVMVLHMWSGMALAHIKGMARVAGHDSRSPPGHAAT